MHDRHSRHRRMEKQVVSWSFLLIVLNTIGLPANVVHYFKKRFEFLQKVFPYLMYPFSWALLGDFLALSASVLRQIARYLPHHRSRNASKTHPKSPHDKFKTASQKRDSPRRISGRRDGKKEEENRLHLSVRRFSSCIRLSDSRGLYFFFESFSMSMSSTSNTSVENGLIFPVSRAP